MASEIEVYSKSEAAHMFSFVLISFSVHLVKIIHLFNGVYLYASILLCPTPSATLTATWHRWEFFTTLDFEWEVFTGKRPWKWSFAVYLTARMLALTSVILNFIGFNLTVHFNCNVSSSAFSLVYTPLILRSCGSVAYSFPRGSRLPSPRSY